MIWKILAGALGASTAVAAVNVYFVQADLKALEKENTRLEVRAATRSAELGNCAARIANLQEVAEANASIPDDLSEFDVPAHWLPGQGGGADTSPGGK